MTPEAILGGSAVPLLILENRNDIAGLPRTGANGKVPEWMLRFDEQGKDNRPADRQRSRFKLDRTLVARG